MKRSELKAFLTKSFDHYKRMPIKTTGYQKISDHVKEILTINLSDGDFQENRQQVEEQINDLQSKVDRIDIVTVALTTVSSSLGEYTIYVILGD